MLRLVINLDRSVDRWQRMDAQFHSLGIPAQRVVGIDAETRDLPLKKISPLGSPEKYFFPRQVSRGEFACYLSHIKCWEALLASNEQWAVIFEDDGLLSRRIKDFILSSDWIPPNIHIIQLHTHYKEWKCRVLPKDFADSKNFHLYNVIDPSYGACCYLIDRKAAQVALDLSQSIAAPVDEFLFNFKSRFTQQFPVMRLNPACVLHNNCAQSVLGVDRYSPKRGYSIRNHLSPKRLYLSAQKKILKHLFCVDVVFTWE